MRAPWGKVALVLLLPFVLGACRFAPWGAGSGVQKGLACWYGNEYHGRPTASGELFNENAMTAAHRDYPYDTLVRVRNTRNGRVCVVRINDRGPFVRGRIIDVSKAAARELGMLNDGVVPVRLEVVAWGRRP